MLKSNVAGVIFAQNENKPLDALIRHRVTASVPFGGRYRVVDFILSSMVNSGISSVSIMVNEKYNSLFDHLGSGKAWNLSRKGDKGLSMLLPSSLGFSTDTTGGDNYFANQLRSLVYFKDFFKKMDNEYIVFANSNVVVNISVEDILANHMASGKDVTVVCTPSYVGEPRYTTYVNKNLSSGKYNVIMRPSTAHGLESVGIFIMSREYLLGIIERAEANMYRYSDADIFNDIMDSVTMNACIFDGYVAKINTIREYYKYNMDLLDKKVRDELFSKDSPIYTKLRDEKPAVYTDTSNVKNSLVTDGCVIKGHVENSILFRTVTVEEGAVVKNCILMSDTHVESGADLSYVITDKRVKITAGSKLCGIAAYPVVINKNSVI